MRTLLMTIATLVLMVGALQAQFPPPKEWVAADSLFQVAFRLAGNEDADFAALHAYTRSQAARYCEIHSQYQRALRDELREELVFWFDQAMVDGASGRTPEFFTNIVVELVLDYGSAADAVTVSATSDPEVTRACVQAIKAQYND